MPDKEYRIRVVTVAEGKGAQESTAGVAELTNATKKSSEANEEHHKSFVHAGNGAHELHKVLHSLAEESPLLGLALRVAISPIGGAFLAAAYAMQLFKKAEEESLKEAKENAEAAAKSIGDMKESVREAAEDIRKHDADFKNWLTSLQSGTDKVKDSLTEELELMQAQAEAKADLLDKEKQLALVKNEERVRTGEITKEQGIVEEGEIERQFAHRGSQDKLDLLQQQFKAKGKALLDTSGQMMTVGGFVDELQGMANDPTRASLLKDLPKRIKSLEEWQPNAQKAVDEATKRVDKAQQDLATAKKFGTAENESSAEERLATAQEQLDRATHQRDAVKEGIERNRKSLDDATTQQSEYSSKLELAKKDFADLDGQFQALSREVESLRIKLSVQGPASAQGTSIGDQIAGSKAFSKLGETDWGKMLLGGEHGGAAGTAFRMLHGETNTTSELQKLDALMKFLGANAQNGQKFLEMIAGAAASIQGMQAAIETLQGQYEFLKNRQPTRLLPGSG